MTSQSESSNDQGGNPPGSEGKNPIDQLVELLVYAPVGLVYEYEDVLPKLIKRGKSQVQLAKVLGQMAAQQGQAKAKQGGEGIDDAVNDALGQAASVLARAITDFGQVIGLAPTSSNEEDSSDEDYSDEEDSPQGAETGLDQDDRPLLPPIAGYDDLKAREIVPLLDDLSGPQRERVRQYELATRGRKTVLGKLDKLDG